MSGKIIYISGKITGLTPEKAKANFDKAKEYLRVKYPDAGVISPYDIWLGKSGTWEEYMKIDIKLLKNSKSSALVANICVFSESSEFLL